MTADASQPWDFTLLNNDGHLLQSTRWGEFKQRHGWQVEQVTVTTDAGTGLAQLLFKTRGPVSYAYLPRGPALSVPDPTLVQVLFDEIDRTCGHHRALGLIIEPDRSLPLPGRYSDWGFVRGPAPIQPERTVKVQLGADDELMAQMHSKTRYNVRLALRRGVTVRQATRTREQVAIFYDLLLDTAGRNAFAIHSVDYYLDVLDVFGDDAILIFAEVEGVSVAGAIAARFGDEAIYLYGGSSTTLRAHGAAFYLQFEIMRWARERGSVRYDMWGIPARDPASSVAASGVKLASSHGDDWRGLYEFKVRFGGDQVRYPPLLERRYQPFLATLARRFARISG
ncbi:MAG: aminoacyltransferase [Chloroflexota bacterium]|nr:aminoacyltransferase [Chloroflexota bacterium]